MKSTSKKPKLLKLMALVPFVTSMMPTRASEIAEVDTQKSFKVRFQCENEKYSQGSSLLNERRMVASWREQAQYIKSREVVKEAEFYHVAKLDEIIPFLELNDNITTLKICKPSSPIDFNFLNNFPIIKSLHVTLLEWDYDEKIINLSSLNYIENLYCSFNEERTVKFPSKSLISLDVNNHLFSSLLSISKLTNLTLRGEHYEKNLISLEGIEKLENLNSLSVSSEYLKNHDLSPIGSLINLSKLRMSALYADKENWFFMQKLTNLKDLYIDYFSKFNIQNIADLPLERFEIGCCSKNFKNLESIGSLKNLKSLKIGSFCEVKDLSPLSKNLLLENLQIPLAHKVSSLEPLRNLPLVRLELGYGRIKDLTPVATLSKLEILNISGNHPVNWDGIKNHPTLKKIRGNKEDFKTPHHMMSRDAWHVPFNSLGAYIKEFELNMDSYDEWYPIKALTTIPNLECIHVHETEIESPTLALFKYVKPNVQIGQYYPF